MFYVENGIALHAMQLNVASSCCEGKSHDFSRVEAGTWGLFSSYISDSPSKLVFVQRCQDSCLVARETSEFSLSHGRAVGTPLQVRQKTQDTFQLPQEYWDSYQFSRGVRHRLFLKH